MTQQDQAATPLTVETAADVILDRLFPAAPAPDTKKKDEAPASEPKPASEEPPKAETPAEEPVEEPKGEDAPPTEDSEEEPPSQPRTFKVVVDGKEEEVTEEELLRGYSGQKHFTQSMQKLADERKAEEERQATRAKEHESTLQGLRSRESELVEKLTAVTEALTALTPEEPNWDELRKQYSKEDVDAAFVEFTKQRERIQRVLTERNRLLAEREKELMEATTKEMDRQRELLIAAIPELKDPEKLGAELRRLTAYGRTQGLSDPELRAITDHRYIQILRKAASYDELMAKKPEVTNRIKEVVRTAAPGAANSSRPPVTDLTRAKQRLAKTGRREDAEAVILHQLEAEEARNKNRR